MGALIEMIVNGVRKGVEDFGGQIVAGVLFAIALWKFPGLRRILGRGQGGHDEDKAAEIQKQLELLQREEEQLAQLKEVLKSHEEALKKTQRLTAEELARRADMQRQLEEQRKEEERVKGEIRRKREEQESIRAEIQRKQEELKRAEAQKAEEARRREEIERQLESQERTVERERDRTGNEYHKTIVYSVALIIVICVFIGLWQLNNEPTDAKAQYELGDKYYYAKDYDRAVYWYRKAADQGYARAQCNLGVMYSNGEGGLPQDKKEAARLYRLAAKQGNAWAQCNLGLMYEYGEGGLPQDKKKLQGCIV